MKNKPTIASLLMATILMLGLSAEALSDIIFEETFFKDASGNLSFPQMVLGDAGPATVVLTNGSGDGFDGVKKGRVELNGDVVYGGLDFKVTGTIFKTVALVGGLNALDISLGGPVGGQMTVQVIQGADEPALEFPPGSIFVSDSSALSEDVAACGTMALPCKTIVFGMTQGGSPVVVASGIYTESVTLISGQDLLGGYNPEFTVRDLATLRAIIRGNPAVPAVISAVNINSSTLLEGFIILAPASSVASADSIGIHVENSTAALQIQNNLIFSGVAGDGANGGVGNEGSNGFNGGNGVGVSRFFTTDPDQGPFFGGGGRSI